MLLAPMAERISASPDNDDAGWDCVILGRALLQSPIGKIPVVLCKSFEGERSAVRNAFDEHQIVDC